MLLGVSVKLRLATFDGTERHHLYRHSRLQLAWSWGGGWQPARLAYQAAGPERAIDKQTLDNLAADAAKLSREELDYYFKTLDMSVTSLRRQNQEQAAAMAILSQQNKDQQAQIDELKLDQVEKQAQIDDLRTDQDEIKAAFEALEWSVRQEPEEVVRPHRDESE
jgi:seryl-tRNA synthetase